jgi:hypothetical protein
MGKKLSNAGKLKKSSLVNNLIWRGLIFQKVERKHRVQFLNELLLILNHN